MHIKNLPPLALGIVFLLFIFVGTSGAQEAIEIGEMLSGDDDISVRDMSRIDSKVTVSDTLEGWDYNWVGGLNGSQASYSNWSQGGVNTVSVTASTVFDLKFRKDRFAYAFATNLKYGKARIEDEGTRKTDDKIAVNNKFNYLFNNDNWSAFGNINFSTQFDNGYNYSVPEGQSPELISAFFSPAYFIQIVGISYSPADYFTAEAGMAMKETIVSDKQLGPRYGLEPGETFRFEPGYSVGLSFDKNIVSNVRLISRAETFTNLQRDIMNTDLSFSNELIGKINNYLNTSLQFVLLYDTDFSKEVQIKQVLSVGFSFSLL